VLTYVRWVLMLFCFATVIAVALSSDGNTTLFLVGLIGAVSCIAGMFIDVFRDKQIRRLHEEVAIHRRVEAHRRNINQRRGA
jgi:hypothetical protein